MRMETGIIICGLNGAGKSTLGKALAEKLGYYFIDSEDLYFPNENSDYNCSSEHTHEEAQMLLFNEIEKPFSRKKNLSEEEIGLIQKMINDYKG